MKQQLDGIDSVQQPKKNGLGVLCDDIFSCKIHVLIDGQENSNEKDGQLRLGPRRRRRRRRGGRYHGVL